MVVTTVLVSFCRYVVVSHAPPLPILRSLTSLKYDAT